MNTESSRREQMKSTEPYFIVYGRIAGLDKCKDRKNENTKHSIKHVTLAIVSNDSFQIQRNNIVQFISEQLQPLLPFRVTTNEEIKLGPHRDIIFFWK